MASLIERPCLGRRIIFWLKQPRFAHMSSSHTPTLSIIIPALNEAHSIGVTLDAVSRLSGRVELIVVDGGSDDETCEIARAYGVKVISSERGRGLQMHRGAAVARGDVFWFLHAERSSRKTAWILSTKLCVMTT